MIKISVLIVTKNWEDTIKKTLDSVKSFYEVIVVIDSKSTNIKLLKKIINKYENTIIYIKDFINFSQIKNFWISQAKCDYILILDDDEYISVWLKLFLKDNINKFNKKWYNIYFQEYMWWQYNKYATWWSYHLRLVKKEVRYTWDVHEKFLLNKKDIWTFNKNNNIFHYSHTSIEKTLNKFNYYTNFESTKYNNIFILYLLLIFSPFYQFILKYFLKLWFLEWGNGFIVSVYRWFYEFIKYSKIIERIKNIKN